jgi:anti-sigma regulatory factor (Ser/Thr protein kinase)
VESGETFFLEIPLDPGYFSTARLFAAAIARQSGCDEASVEDLKLAVSEACNNVVFASKDRPLEEVIRIDVTQDADRVAFEITDGGIPIADLESTSPETTPSTFEYGRLLGVELIRTLFPDAELLSNSRGGVNIRFSLPTGRGSGPV